ncbi:hypothetical protein QBK99_21655 [Corticibacterium sp. UT-5YL-CI-8]|nr:hypothetical protein [Tianweitania sp. UT-5YL-CI-8]
MNLSGKAGLAIWHDVTLDHDAEYQEWHGREHMPERLAIPGILRGRRYRAISGGPANLTLYEVRDVDDVTGEDYLQRRRDLTPWSRAMIAQFRTHERLVLRVRISRGMSVGGLCAAWRFTQKPAHPEKFSAVVDWIAGIEGVAAVHWLAVDKAASKVGFETASSACAAAVPTEWILLVESWLDVGAFELSTVRIAERLQPDGVVSMLRLVNILGPGDGQ